MPGWVGSQEADSLWLEPQPAKGSWLQSTAGERCCWFYGHVHVKDDLVGKWGARGRQRRPPLDFLAKDTHPSSGLSLKSLGHPESV